MLDPFHTSQLPCVFVNVANLLRRYALPAAAALLQGGPLSLVSPLPRLPAAAAAHACCRVPICRCCGAPSAATNGCHDGGARRWLRLCRRCAAAAGLLMALPRRAAPRCAMGLARPLPLLAARLLAAVCRSAARGRSSGTARLLGGLAGRQEARLCGAAGVVVSQQACMGSEKASWVVSIARDTSVTASWAADAGRLLYKLA